MPLFYRNKRTGLIFYGNAKNANRKPDMIPVYGRIVDGVFIEVQPKSELVKQIQELGEKPDSLENIQDLIKKKFNIAITGNLRDVMNKALDLARKWEALNARINDLRDEIEDDDEPDGPVEDLLDEHSAKDPAADDEKQITPDYRNVKDMLEWTEDELRDYIHTDYGIDGRKLTHKKQPELLAIAQDLDEQKRMVS